MILQNTNKPALLQPGDSIGWNDQSERVPITWPTTGTESPEADLLDTLLDLGAVIQDRQAAIRAIGEAYDAIGDSRAADALGIILSRLPGGRRGAELRQALLGSMGEGCEAANKCGMSKQAFFQSVDRLRARIFKKR